LFFTDAATHRILRWNDRNNSAETLSEAVDSPVTLGYAGNGELLAIDSNKGVVYAPRSNMAITGVTEDEPRSFFYAPQTSTAIMAGGSWKGLLQAVQLGGFRIGTSRFAVSEEDDKVYRFTLDSLNYLSAVAVIPRSGTSVVADAAGNVYVAGAEVFVY